MPRPKSLKFLLAAAFMPVALGPLTLVALVVLWQYQEEERSLDRAIQAELLEVTTVQRALVDGLWRKVVGEARLIAAAWPGMAAKPDPDKDLATFVYQARTFNQVSVVGPDGTVRRSSSRAQLGRSVRDQAWWTLFQQRRTLTFSGLLHGEGGRRFIQVLLPLPGQDVLVASYDALQLQDAFKDALATQQGRATFIVDGRGTVIAHTEEQEVMLDRNLSALPPVQRAIRGDLGAITFTASPGAREQTAAYFPLPWMGWSIITVQPGAKELLLPVREARQLTLVALTFASLLAIAATAWLSLRLARPVEAFAHHLGELARQGGEFRAEAPFAAPAIAEYAQMVESAGRLHASLSASIAKLAARTHELQLANQETTARAEQLERLDKLRTEFLDALSHDLRIPLTAIQGYVELLEDLDDPALGTAGRQYVEHIDEGRKRMQVMVEDLLDQARLGVGRLVLHRERVDLAALLQQTGAFFEPLARDKALRFEVSWEDPAPRPEADPNRLVQILNNLISNAIKYTPAGGRVEVSARAVGPDAEIAVADTGVGLDPEDKAHLFEKFYRSKRPEVQREHGSGLGLALAKGLVEAHGGRLEVDSTLGEGTVFRCYLPLAPVTAGGVPG